MLKRPFLIFLSLKFTTGDKGGRSLAVNVERGSAAATLCLLFRSRLLAEIGKLFVPHLAVDKAVGYSIGKGAVGKLLMALHLFGKRKAPMRHGRQKRTADWKGRKRHFQERKEERRT